MTEPPSLVEQQEPPPEAAQAAAPVAAAPAPRRPLPPAAQPPAAPAAAAPDVAGVHAGPSVRRMAREFGIDLGEVTGNGPKGRITKEDLLGFLRGPAEAPTPAAAPAAGMGIPEIPAQDFSKYGPVETKPLARIKRLSGPFLHRSWLNVPHVTHNDDADITDLDKYRKELDSAAKADGYRVTLLAFLVKACVSALKQFPEFNSSLSPEKDSLILKKFYNIGIAVDTPDGLVVPVVKDADRKGITELSKEFGDISKKARDGKLSPGECRAAPSPFESWRHRRDQLHADRQRPRGCDSRRGAVEDVPSLERIGVRPTDGAAALVVLRPSGDRRRAGRAVHPAAVPPARRRPPASPVKTRGTQHERCRNSGPRHRRLQRRAGDRDARQSR